METTGLGKVDAKRDRGTSPDALRVFCPRDTIPVFLALRVSVVARCLMHRAWNVLQLRLLKSSNCEPRVGRGVGKCQEGVACPPIPIYKFSPAPHQKDAYMGPKCERRSFVACISVIALPAGHLGCSISIRRPHGVVYQHNATRLVLLKFLYHAVPC